MSKSSASATETKRPSMFWLATEIGRAVTELGLSVPFRTFYKKEEEGDGHPVLVLPGFMSTDKSTLVLRKFINKLGYTAYGWEMGRNYAKVKFLEALLEKVDRLYKEHDEPITLIGWSLGGVYARQIAKARPKKIRQVIMMGTPFRGVTKPNNVAWIYNLIKGSKRASDLNQALIEDIPLPAPVPTTSIYSKEDGVVPWELCMEEVEDSKHQNIQVRGSHLGFGVNPTVLEIVANRLQYNSRNWEHFKPENIVKDVLFYPSL